MLHTTLIQSFFSKVIDILAPQTVPQNEMGAAFEIAGRLYFGEIVGIDDVNQMVKIAFTDWHGVSETNKYFWEIDTLESISNRLNVEVTS